MNAFSADIWSCPCPMAWLKRTLVIQCPLNLMERHTKAKINFCKICRSKMTVITTAMNAICLTNAPVGMLVFNGLMTVKQYCIRVKDVADVRHSDANKPKNWTKTAQYHTVTLGYTLCAVARLHLNRLAAWYLPGGSVGPPARWPARSNVKGGSVMEEGAQGPLARKGGLLW